jgi:hypothetical protein
VYVQKGRESVRAGLFVGFSEGVSLVGGRLVRVTVFRRFEKRGRMGQHAAERLNGHGVFGHRETSAA